MKTFNENNFEFFSEKAQRERIRLHNKYTPKMQGWDFEASDELGGYIFRFDYETDKYKSSLYLPILNLLPEIEFTPEVKSVKLSNPWRYMRDLIKKPLVSMSLGVGAVISFCKTAVDLHKYRFGSAAYNNMSGVYARMIGLTLSLTYIGCAVFAYAILPILRRKLITRFDHIEYDLNCILPWQPEGLWNKHQIRLPLIYSIILSRYFPGNRDLKWRFYYLDASCYEVWNNSGCAIQYNEFNPALEYVDTLDQKFLCLRRIINSAYLAESRISVYEDFEQHIKPCVDQISSASKLHQELGALLRGQLQDCLNTLVNGNHLLAIEKFNAIKFDGYAKKAYPGATILYYQLDAVLTLLGKDNRLFDGYVPCDGSRLGAPGHSFCIVRENIDKYYQHLSSVMYNFAYNFSEFLRDLPSEIKPKPGKPIITLANSNRHFKILSVDADDNLDSMPVGSIVAKLELL
mgnify:CR=1 FL=1